MKIKTKKKKWKLKDLNNFSYFNADVPVARLVEKREAFIERMGKWKPSTITGQDECN